jgi:hypothetical protein
MRRVIYIILSIILILASVAFFTSTFTLQGPQATPGNPLNTVVKAVVSTVAFLSGLVSLIKNVKDLIDDWKVKHPASVNPAQGKMEQTDAQNAISPGIKEK